MCQKLYKLCSWTSIIKCPLQAGASRKMEVKLTYFEILRNTTMRGQPQKRQHGWHLLGVNSMLVSSGCRSRHSYNLRTRSSIQTPLRQLRCWSTPTNLGPRCRHVRASLTEPGPGPGKMDAETDIRYESTDSFMPRSPTARYQTKLSHWSFPPWLLSLFSKLSEWAQPLLP